MNPLDKFYESYVQDLTGALALVDLESLEQAAHLINDTYGTVWVGGNGGSCAIANHLCCDMSKGTARGIKTISLTSNMPLVTAIANDLGYFQTLSHQLDMFSEEEDTLILISSSGRSPNIVFAAEKAKKLGIPLIGFTGFDGGKLKELADISIHIQSDNYGIIEDCHQAIMHMISQYIAKHLPNS